MNLLQLDSFRFCLLSFSALASRSGCGATISDAVARTSIAFCDSVSADRIVMAASRLLRAVAVFVILLSFAAGLRKSYWSGCMKAATVICQQIFSILASVIFLLKILFKKYPSSLKGGPPGGGLSTLGGGFPPLSSKTCVIMCQQPFCFPVAHRRFH